MASPGCAGHILVKSVWNLEGGVSGVHLGQSEYSQKSPEWLC